MKTYIGLLSLVLVMGTSACSNADDSATSLNDDLSIIREPQKSDAVSGGVATVRRRARMDARAACIRTSNADTWNQLSLTTDQIRWMEQLQVRMNARNEKASETVQEPGKPFTYTFSPAERRTLAEILTDEQMDQWTSMCPDQEVAARM